MTWFDIIGSVAIGYMIWDIVIGCYVTYKLAKSKW